MADTPQFELDASRMKRGMMTSPLKYRKMYGETPETPASAGPTARDKQINDAEARAMGPDGTYSEPGNSGSSINR